MEEIAEPAFAKAEDIPGRGIEVADTRAPRRFERGIGVLLRDDRELIAKRHAAQAEADRGLVVFRRSCLHAGLSFCLRGGRPVRQGSCCRATCSQGRLSDTDHSKSYNGARSKHGERVGWLTMQSDANQSPNQIPC